MSDAVLAGARGPEYLAPAWIKDPSLLPGATPVDLVWPTLTPALSVLLVLVVLAIAAVVALRHGRRSEQSRAALELSVGGAPSKRHAA